MAPLALQCECGTCSEVAQALEKQATGEAHERVEALKKLTDVVVDGKL